MRRFLTFFLLLITSSGMTQVAVDVYPADTILCYHDSIAFQLSIDTTGTGILSYQWMKNNVNIPGANDSVFGIGHISGRDTAFYKCIINFVSQSGTFTDTSNYAHLRMYPKMKIDTLYRQNSVGCLTKRIVVIIPDPPYKDTVSVPNCKATYVALVSGGAPPYYCNWNGKGSLDTIVYELCPGRGRLIITDSLGCTIDTSYFVDAFKSPKVDFTISPNDTVVYLTNPNIQVAYPDSMRQYIDTWTWNFGDNVKVPKLNPCAHAYAKVGRFPVKLFLTDNINGCDTTITKQVTVKVAKLKIPNVFTPNGDGFNDTFTIEIEQESKDVDYRLAYLSNEFVVYDRWGKKVFSQPNYKSGDWTGDKLSDGTYFFVLKCIGQYGDDVFRGSVTIFRGTP